MTGGRPSKLNETTKNRFIKALQTGAHIETACNAAGVSYSTARQWIARGEGRSDRSKASEYADFAAEVSRAIADAEMALVSRVYTASTEDWRAASFLLERRHPERWSNTQKIRVEVEKELDATLDKIEQRLPPELFRQVLSAIAGVAIDHSELSSHQSVTG